MAPAEGNVPAVLTSASARPVPAFLPFRRGQCRLQPPEGAHGAGLEPGPATAGTRLKGATPGALCCGASQVGASLPRWELADIRTPAFTIPYLVLQPTPDALGGAEVFSGEKRGRKRVQSRWLWQREMAPPGVASSGLEAASRGPRSAGLAQPRGGRGVTLTAASQLLRPVFSHLIVSHEFATLLILVFPSSPKNLKILCSRSGVCSTSSSRLFLRHSTVFF